MTNNNQPFQWQPVIGEETRQLMERLPGFNEPTRQRIQQSAAAILGRCTPPHIPGGTTGLVLGQVQSGKTMSFTTVATVARDNSYRIVIVITGTTIPLMRQSVDRLRRDLGIENENRVWRHIRIEHARSPHIQTITDTLSEWTDPDVPPQERPTLLITVLKQHQNLASLTRALRQIDLRESPTLIIDDEADQASLNTQVLNAGQSTTYMRILELRNVVPRHTFLQYTATPQALLLINIIDTLSPRFIHVLEAGDGYCGGQSYFMQFREQTIREIPVTGLSTRQQPLHEPPPTFFQALRIFFVGVAESYCRGETSHGNRSMMIHPSMFRDEHALYEHWVEQTKEEWGRILNLPNGNPEKEELLNEFRESITDLRRTEPNLSPDDQLLGPSLRWAVRRAGLQVLNARGGRTPSVDWGAQYGLILIGGTALDRGFTVKGLTVTYMPRPLGGRMADTLQQRGRFFGYRASHFNFCRVFLPNDVTDAFQYYVEHENDLRDRLHAFEGQSVPLTDWARIFILDPNLRPTRNSLIDIAYRFGVLGNEWAWTKSPHITAESGVANARIVDEFCDGITFEEDEGSSSRTEHQKHFVASNLELGMVLRDFLVRLQFRSMEDSQQHIATLSLLQRIIENDSRTQATIYLMSKGNNRIRKVDAEDRIAGSTTLFQGANPSEKGPRRGSIYPGDSAIHATQGITIQIHFLAIIRKNGERCERVPAIAIWIPQDLARPILIQPQGRI